MDERTVSFSIEGGFFTEKAREVLLSELPGKAWKLVAHGLMGPGAAEAAQGILDATHRLEGVNDLELVEEDQDDPEVQRYLKDLAYIYAGRVRINGAWYRPSAMARPNSASARDAADFVEGENLPLRAASRAWAMRVGQWFAYQGEIVRLVGRKVTLWEPCGEPPFWWDEHRDEAAAIADFEAKRYALKFRGRDKDGRDSEALEGVSKSLAAQSDDLEEESREAARAARETREDERAARYKALCIEIGEKVREQAGDDTFELVVSPERTVTVPRAPFWCWALERTKLRHMSPPWETVSPTGMKLQLDEPNHTDWMLGAGLDLGEDYGFNSPVTRAATNEQHRIQEEVGDYEAAVLVDFGMTKGEVGKQILVLPHLGPAHAAAAMEPGVLAIITEVGGELAHLATIGREFGWTIMRVRDAMTRYPVGTVLTMDPETGKIWGE